MFIDARYNIPSENIHADSRTTESNRDLQHVQDSHADTMRRSCLPLYTIDFNSFDLLTINKLIVNDCKRTCITHLRDSTNNQNTNGKEQTERENLLDKFNDVGDGPIYSDTG